MSASEIKEEPKAGDIREGDAQRARHVPLPAPEASCANQSLCPCRPRIARLFHASRDTRSAEAQPRWGDIGDRNRAVILLGGSTPCSR